MKKNKAIFFSLSTGFPCPTGRVPNITNIEGIIPKYFSPLKRKQTYHYVSIGPLSL